MAGGDGACVCVAIKPYEAYAKSITLIKGIRGHLPAFGSWNEGGYWVNGVEKRRRRK